MTRIHLTPTERKTLRIIGRMTDTRGIPPTYRELALELGVASPSTPHYAVDRLVRKGYVKRADRTSRGLLLTQRGITEQQPRSMTKDEQDLNRRIASVRSAVPYVDMDDAGEFFSVTFSRSE